MAGPHSHHPDDRNEHVLVYVNGELKPRGQAMVSVFDSGFLMGDGVWEGLRVHGGKVPFLDAHLDRLFEGARALDLDVGRTRQELVDALYETIRANDMVDGVHVRLMVTRGLKRTPFQGPSVNVGQSTLVIAAEWKEPDPAVTARGLDVMTVYVRRGRPDVQDPAWNSHSKLNCVTACIQAGKMGADEGLMLDPHGFVATCNSTHFFIVRKGELWTSTGRYCLRGITRAKVLELAEANGIRTRECDFPLTQVYGADEVFCTGTFSGIVPVRSVDGRGYELPGPITTRLTELYAAAVRAVVGKG
ncbi:MAG: aminotransferase class IV [Proteobacteria bacterium]|nr:aminotransferase class IV [Pseudomonadota bacterium]MCP4922265.1 aminotransferase class IV [Pseudomonadota bacterium]